MKRVCLAFSALCFVFNFYSQNLTSNSTGSFIYTPVGPLSSQPVEVFYHIPNGDMTTMPIVMSFHGGSRNGSDYRNYWIAMADANDFMVFAPEFTTSNYPGLGDNYLMANIFDDGDNPSPSTFNNPDEWTFSILDPLFDYIKADINGTQQRYNGWGHSGGAQFLHRFVLYMPNSNLDVAVCSNAGWYTVPENGVSFPYGILNGQLPNSDLISAFSKKLIVHLGQNDIDPNSPGLRHNTTVDNQQGLFRLERGQYFFSTSQTKAQNQNATFNWEKHEVPNVGHDPQQMANDALPYILMNTLSINQTVMNSPLETVSLFPNPVQTGVVSISVKSDLAFDVQVFNVLGQPVIGQSAKGPVELDVSHLKSGIYLAKISTNYKAITKKLVIE